MMGLKLFVLLLVVAAAVSSPVAESPENVEEYNVRLPGNLLPRHELVQIQPFINSNFSIHGFVEITFDVVEPTNKIILHIADIVTHNDTIKVYPSSGTPADALPIEKHENYAPNELYIATMAEDLQAETSYKIQMRYEGYLNPDLRGFYRSSYENEDGEKVWLAVTQFEATDARRAFPCFDEPGLKANFTIEITHENNMTSASNMPIVESVPAEGQDGWTTDKYQTTVPMSTYLVAFLVSDFEHKISENSSPNYNFGVFARKEFINQTQYALEVGTKVLSFYEKYFNVSFPLPKMDMVALPDFSAGAMENWGLITYREVLLLFNEGQTTAADKESIGVVIAHELAHQWFGDIVSPSWWEYLWLNEGFASYMEYVGLNSVEPEMRMLELIVIQDRYVAFSLDSLQSSHPVRVSVSYPDEINQIFDAISYQKGSCIIRMMNLFLTEESFTGGLSKYLKGMSYQAAKQDDLWRYLSDQAHSDGNLPEELSLKEIMDTWTLQMGYPVLQVALNGQGSAELSQSRFLLVESNSTSDDHDYKWWIPITFTHGGSPDFTQTKASLWMSAEETTKTIEVPEGDQWFIFNTQASGYYRVNYDQSNWDKLVAQLTEDHEVINNLNRAQIIDDSLNLARSGHLDYETAFNILAYLKNEKDYMPLKAALQNIKYLKNMFAHSGGYGALKSFLLSILSPHYEELTFDDSLEDPHVTQLLRADVLDWVCGLGYEPCVQKAVELYRSWMADPDNYDLISPNLKQVVYCTAIAEGGVDEWHFAWERYQTTSRVAEKVLLMKAMTCSSQEWILAEYLNRTLTPGKGIRSQDVGKVIEAMSLNSNARLLAWATIRENWSAITKNFGFTLDSFIAAPTETLNTQVQVQEIQNFMEKEEGNFFLAHRTIQQGLETAQNNVAWMQKHYETIYNWLQENGHDSGL